MRRISGFFFTVTGFLVCPCHLFVTLPLAASLLTGTALGSFLTHNTSMVIAFAGLYFIVALLLGGWLLFKPAYQENGGITACTTCLPQRQEKSECKPLNTLHEVSLKK